MGTSACLGYRVQVLGYHCRANTGEMELYGVFRTILGLYKIPYIGFAMSSSIFGWASVVVRWRAGFRAKLLYEGP